MGIGLFIWSRSLCIRRVLGGERTSERERFNEPWAGGWWCYRPRGGYLGTEKTMGIDAVDLELVKFDKN